MNVYYRKTVVGWWNVYPAGSDDQFINLTPKNFSDSYRKYLGEHSQAALKSALRQRESCSVRRCGQHDG